MEASFQRMTSDHIHSSFPSGVAKGVLRRRCSPGARPAIKALRNVGSFFLAAALAARICSLCSTMESLSSQPQS